MFRSPSVPPLIVDNWQGPDRRHYSKTADHWKTAAVSTTASCFLSMTSALREEIGWFKISRFLAEKRKKVVIFLLSVLTTQLKSLSMALEEFTGWCVLVFLFWFNLFWVRNEKMARLFFIPRGFLVPYKVHFSLFLFCFFPPSLLFILVSFLASVLICKFIFGLLFFAPLRFLFLCYFIILCFI